MTKKLRKILVYFGGDSVLDLEETENEKIRVFSVGRKITKLSLSKDAHDDICFSFENKRINFIVDYQEDVDKFVFSRPILYTFKDGEWSFKTFDTLSELLISIDFRILGDI